MDFDNKPDYFMADDDDNKQSTQPTTITFDNDLNAKTEANEPQQPHARRSRIAVAARGNAYSGGRWSLSRLCSPPLHGYATSIHTLPMPPSEAI